MGKIDASRSARWCGARYSLDPQESLQTGAMYSRQALLNRRNTYDN